MSTQTDQHSTLKELAQSDPTSHPVPFSLVYFDHDLSPPKHLQDWYHQLWKAIYKEQALRNTALFAPRGYAKTVSTIKVFPAWLAVNFPEIRIGVLSHKKKHANRRAETAVNSIERVCEQLNIPIEDASKTTIQLEAGKENIEPTLEPGSIRTENTGSHYDVVIYDDVATFANQTTAHKDTIRRQFTDTFENVAAKDGASCLPHGSVNVVIGTRKDPNDLYREKILRTNEYNWDGFVAKHVGQADWNARVWRATTDWHVIENEAYIVHGTDGETYRTVRDVPDDVDIIDIEPEDDFRTLWPEFHPSNSVLEDVVTKSSSTVWQCENQQNPEATKGQVLKLDWLRFTDPIPRGDYDAYEWYAGLDFANPDNLEAEMRGESDYWALSVVAYDRENEVSFIVDQWRDRGLSWLDAAQDFVNPHLQDYPVGKLLVESNFSGGEIAETIEDNTGLDVKKSPSDGEKEERLQSMANKFQQGKYKIAADPEMKKWESFIRDEWLAFPEAEHDDRMDSMEIALRGPDTSGSWVEEDELENITFQ